MKNNKIIRRMKKIRIKEKDEINGFYVLISELSSFVCLPNNEYIVPDELLEKLKKEKITYEKLF